MVSTVDILSEQPWGQTYFEWHSGHNLGWAGQKSYPYDFNAQFKLIKDQKGNFWFRGDIVRFNTGYHNWKFDHDCPWKRWFMSKEDYLNALANDDRTCRDHRLPKYARLEYGIILSRYKWSKEKPGKFYYDYGSIIMMLTGPKAGKIRRYYVKTPYSKISSYPYDHVIPYYTINYGITEVPEIARLQEAMHYAKSKDQFILNMIESFHNENYPMNLEGKHDTTTNFRLI